MATLSVRFILTMQESSDQELCLHGARPEQSCTRSLQVIKLKAMAEQKLPLPMQNLAFEECSLRLRLTSVVGPSPPAVSTNSGEEKPMELWKRSHRFSVRFSPENVSGALENWSPPKSRFCTLLPLGSDMVTGLSELMEPSKWPAWS